MCACSVLVTPLASAPCEHARLLSTLVVSLSLLVLFLHLKHFPSLLSLAHLHLHPSALTSSFSPSPLCSPLPLRSPSPLHSHCHPCILTPLPSPLNLTPLPSPLHPSPIHPHPFTFTLTPLPSPFHLHPHSSTLTPSSHPGG